MLPFVENNGKSTTQFFSPVYRKFVGLKFSPDQQFCEKENQTQEMKKLNHQYIHIKHIIDNVSTILDNRMNVHERELLTIMKTEIQNMLEDVQRVVNEYNELIREQRFTDDIHQPKNQVDFFKFEAVRVYQQNKILKNEIKQLRQQISLDQFELVCCASALKNMGRKLAKNKAINNTVSITQICQSKQKKKNCYSSLSIKTNALQFQTLPQKLKTLPNDTINTNINSKPIQKSSIDSPNIEHLPHSQFQNPKLQLKTNFPQNTQNNKCVNTDTRNPRNYFHLKHKFYCTRNHFRSHRFSQSKNQ